jgi:hypothetical protein
MFIGDFNAIISLAEKKGGRIFGSSSHSLFGNFVHDNGLVDLGYSRNPFTWNNKHQGRYNIKEHLDRGLSNHLLVFLFPNSHLSHLLASKSDYNPLLLSTSSNFPKLPKNSKFEAFWTRDISSHAIIADAWNTPFNGSTAFALSRKTKASKSSLKSWNIHHFGNIHLKCEAHAALLAVSLAVSVGYSSLILEGDSLLTIVAINDPPLFLDWASAPVIFDLHDLLLPIPIWSALKISRSANVCAHNVAIWAASHLMFGSIPSSSSFLSSVRFRSDKDPPL